MLRFFSFSRTVFHGISRMMNTEYLITSFSVTSKATLMFPKILFYVWI
jgi:hypothetical protein